ncbi:MAG: putative DNA binding domain-containing protein [Candidatus Sumerlaeota bacterium]|nr:putative DNA binding domain-containing protein [Candidatus Sumerlaeota bacterium]
MSSILPINIDDLLHHRGVESSRLEFKASWDDKVTGYQVLKTICAFANDLQNLYGGYIIIGVAEQDGVAILPPKGLTATEVENAQKMIRVLCNRLDPGYQPVIATEIVDGKHILVLWAPGSDTRPHRAPDGEKGDRKYWVRLGCETVDAERCHITQDLIRLTARVPFDSRRANNAQIEDMRETIVREFLQDIRSGLCSETDAREIYRRMRICAPANDHEIPLNIGLLFFSDDPERWFPGARIEVTQFAGGPGGNVQDEQVFRGPLQAQIRKCMSFLESFSSQHIEKLYGSVRVRGWVSYPLPALWESVVNAVYHRSYEADNQEPVKIFLFPDRIEIISYPGPVPGVDYAHLAPGGKSSPAPSRNRRIGEFLKELRLAEGKGTGLPKIYNSMEQNGSPRPVIEFDEHRTYFRMLLPAHPEYAALSALRDAAYLQGTGDAKAAFERLESAWHDHPSSATLAAELIRRYFESGKISGAQAVYEQFKKAGGQTGLAHVLNVMINGYFEAKMHAEAKRFMDEMPALLSSSEAIDAAILARRLGREEVAHRYFERAGDVVMGDARALLEFAQAKIHLAQSIYRRNPRSSANKKLLGDALHLLERVTQLEASPIRHAWAWRDIARVRQWLKAPFTEIKAAYQRAIEILPDQAQFKDELKRIESFND